MFPDNTSPQLISPVYVYMGDQPIQTGTIVVGGSPATSSVMPQSSLPSSSQGPQPIPSCTTTNSPSPSSSTSTATSYAHTIPATTIKFPSQTFTIPSVSLPSIHIPTPSDSSFPHSLPNGNNNGLNANTNNPNSGGHFIPVKNDEEEERVALISHSATSCSDSANEENEAHQHKSGLKRSKRHLFFEELDVLSSREVEQPVERVPFVPKVKELKNARRSRRHRFAHHFVN
jgi:hypothetical protein